MGFDKDILYFGTLFVCIAMGRYYKKLELPEVKRNYGAGLGIAVICLVCRQYAMYSLALVWVNVMIIKCSDKRYVNELSISFTWIFLMYICSMVGPQDYVMYINQILALRVVGLASEINKVERLRLEQARVAAQVPVKGQTLQTETTLSPDDAKLLEVNAIEVCAYAFHFIGMHKGPYYRFKEYTFHFNSPFTQLGDFRLITSEKLKKTLTYIMVYAILRFLFSTKVYYDEDFYKNTNMELRFLYNIPLLLMFVLRHEILVMLSTCVFTEAGFGVYPALCAAVPGHGPTAFENLLSDQSEAVLNASDYEYNFAVLRCFDNKRMMIGPKLRDTLHWWDTANRYWFRNYVYNNLHGVRMEVRSAVSFTAWAAWMGLNMTHLILAATLWVWVNLEHEYSLLYNTNDSSVRTAWNIGFSIMRMLCIIYLTPCLVINDTFAVLRFYNSIYWIFHLTILGLILLAIALFKVRVAPLPPRV